MYRTHRCSVHVASFVSIYGYGTAFMRSCRSMSDVSIMRRAFSLEITFWASLLLKSEQVQSHHSFWIAPLACFTGNFCIPHHNLPNTVVSAMEAPHLHIKFVPKRSHYGELMDFPVYIPFAYDYSSSSCLLYTSPSPRDRQKSRMPSSA